VNKDKVRALLNQFFKERDLDKDVEKLYPLIDKKRLMGILDGSQDFAKSDVMVICSVAMEFVDGKPTKGMFVDPKSEAVLQQIRNELGDIQGIARH
jgi:hypothetical protein